MRGVRTHAHEDREPATTGRVRPAGADEMRAAAQRAHLGASTPPVFEAAGYSTSRFDLPMSGNLRETSKTPSMEPAHPTVALQGIFRSGIPRRQETELRG
jgi:hypothetical protein